MRKSVSILSLAILLFSQTELHQLLRVPKLISHFIEHKEKKPDLSFFQFMKMHYSVDNDRDGDGLKDRELPFKSTESAQCFSAVVFIPENITEFILFNFDTQTTQYLQVSATLPHGFSGLIWQPPKLS